jgi:hypothetical protein
LAFVRKKIFFGFSLPSAIVLFITVLVLGLVILFWPRTALGTYRHQLAGNFLSTTYSIYNSPLISLKSLLNNEKINDENLTAAIYQLTGHECPAAISGIKAVGSLKSR